MIDFQLEPQAQTPVVKTCGNCRHFRPHVDKVTKRVHPSKPGRCGWEHGVGWPMPMARRFAGDTVWEAVCRLGSAPVFAMECADGCKCWDEKK